VGDGRSVCPKSSGLHACYNGWDNGMQLREEKPIPQTQSKSGLRAVTRPHEDGIPSNRVSSSRGEHVPAPCTHRPSHHPSGVRTRSGPLVRIEPTPHKGG
jgi:hypothetical protein